MLQGLILPTVKKTECQRGGNMATQSLPKLDFNLCRVVINSVVPHQIPASCALD